MRKEEDAVKEEDAAIKKEDAVNERRCITVNEGRRCCNKGRGE